jgi:hypothetical protein
MHRLHFFGSLSLCTAVLSLAACDNGGGVVPIEQLPARIAPSYCALFDRCENPFITQYLFLGGACEDSIEPLLEDSFIGRATEAIRAGTVVYHGELVSSCLAALDASGCSVDSLGGSTCTEIFTGTVSAGGDCNWDEECVAGYCSTSDGMCPGTCAARIAEGGTCNGAGCEPGLSCVSGTCQRPATAGQPCEGAGEPPCSGIDLTCVGSSSETAGTCTAWSDVLSGGVGAPCNVPDDLCDEGLSCVFAGVVMGMASFECAMPVAADAACSLGYPDPCPDHQYCMMGGTPGMGTCTPLPTAGQPCASGQCAVGLRCSSTDGGMGGVCVVPARLGQPCTGDGGCVSGSCEDGVCSTPGC